MGGRGSGDSYSSRVHITATALGARNRHLRTARRKVEVNLLDYPHTAYATSQQPEELGTSRIWKGRSQIGTGNPCNFGVKAYRRCHGY